MRFGSKLKALRDKAALSLEDLSEATGGVVSRQSLSQYERGERSPTWAAVQAIAAALNVPTDVFRDKE